jgi:hypothetical protein
MKTQSGTKLTRLVLRNKNKINKPKISTGKSNEINIFNLGTLLQFETHCWQAVKRISKDKAKKYGKAFEKGWMKANKNLIDRKKLDDIQSYISDARKLISSVSLPFPIKGIYFIPNDSVEKVNEGLSQIASGMLNSVDEFADHYNMYIEEAREESEEFNEQDYPLDIKSRFGISWRFFEMTIPSSITNEMKAEENKRFNDLMQQAKHEAVLALRTGFAEIVTHLTDTLSGKLDGEEKRLRASSIEKVTEFFKEFQSKNVFNDSELESLIKKAKNVVRGVTPKDLREDEDLTKQIHKQLGEIKKELDSSTEKVRRRFSF